MKYTFLIFVAIFLFCINLHAQNDQFNLDKATSDLPQIYGLPQNSEHLYVTAGNRLYCIGDQSGGFPEVGFHLPGKMGGIWQHPIKLLDGFSFSLRDTKTGIQYKSMCDSFITSSFTTKFRYHIPNEKITIVQTQFVPDKLPVLVVEYKIGNTSDQERNFEIELNTAVDLMPVWLGESSGMTDHRDTLDSFDKNHAILYFRDMGNPWYTGIGFEKSHIRYKTTKKPSNKGNGITGITSLQCIIPATSSIIFRFYLSGSLTGKSEIEQNISAVRWQLPNLFSIKKARFDSIEKTAQITIPDKLLETAYNWGKYSTDWLVRDVPGLGQGLSAGLPDYPWFFSNDQATTFMGLTGTIQPQIFYNSFSMLKRISDKTNESCGRIIHEVSTNGVVFDKGRMEESQLHIISAWHIFKWTGNLQFLKENYEFAKKTWNWLQQHDANHNGYIEGYGGTEIEGLNDEMLDVQVNTFEFLNILSQMATIFKEPNDAREYVRKAEILKNQINRDWWIESENRYADFITSKEKALKIINEALAKRVHPGRNGWAGIKLSRLREDIINNTYSQKGYVVYCNSSGLQPMEAGIADTLSALRMLKGASFFTNRFGEYVCGIERPDDVTIDEKKSIKDSVFTYYRAVMPAATAGLAVAAAKYGMPDTALMYMHRILNTFSYATPGTTYEVSPDYGMFVQAWNTTGINIPLIQYFFGVQPNAYNQEITLQLRMPTAWNNAELKNLIVGNNRLCIHYTKTTNRITCEINSSEPGWKIHFLTEVNANEFDINQKQLINVNHSVELTGIHNKISYSLK